MNQRQVIVLCISVLSLFYGTVVFSQCQFNGPVSIDDLNTTSINIDVTGSTNNDLSDPGQGVCGIQIEFNHSLVGDLVIQLISPSGQSIFLLGPSGPFGATDFTRWDITFLPCSDVAIPDPGFNANWNNNQNWGVFGNYSGTYYPHIGCLEDFNVGPVDGQWTLLIQDGQPFDDGTLVDFNLIFCDPDGLDCTTCTPEGGSFIASEYIECVGSDALNFVPEINFPFDTPDSMVYDYKFILSEGNRIVGFFDSLTLDTFSVGNYEICGVSFSRDDSSKIVRYVDSSLTVFINVVNNPDSSLCADLSNTCIPLTIAPYPRVNMRLDSLSCKRDMVFFDPLASTPFSTYIWTRPGGIMDTVQSIVASEAGDYSLRVISNHNCIADTTFSLVLDTMLPLIDISDTTINCDSSIIYLDAVPYDDANTYLWVNELGDSIHTARAEFQGPGKYFLTVTGANGCVNRDSVTITLSGDVQLVRIIGDTLDCVNTLVTLTAHPPDSFVQFQWSGPANNYPDSSNISVDEPGLYSVSVVTETGCSSKDSFYVDIDTARPLIQAWFEIQSCVNGTFILGADGLGTEDSLKWSGPNMFTSSLQNPIVSDSGTYSLVTFQENGCSGMDTIRVPMANSGRILSITQDLNCADSIAFLQVLGVHPTDSVVWEDPPGNTFNSFSIEGRYEGIYQVVVIDSLGCSFVDSSEVSFSISKPESEFEISHINCKDSVGSIEVFIDFNEYRIEWESDLPFIEVMNGIQTSSPGNYNLRILDNRGCSWDSILIVDENQTSPLANITLPDSSRCDEASWTLSALGSSLGNRITYEWSTDDGLIIGDHQAFTVEVGENGNYALIVTDTVNGCHATATEMFATEDGPVEIELVVQDIDCNHPVGGQVTIENVEGGLAPYLYSLNGNAFVPDSQFMDLMEGSHNIEVMDANGCTITRGFEIENNSNFVVSVGPDVYSDGQDPIVLIPNTNLSISLWSSYGWTSNQGISCSMCDTLVIDPVVAGVYAFTLEDSAGCKETDALEVFVDRNFQIYIPNAFSPNGDGVNDIFRFYTSGNYSRIKTWKIFDRWGNQVFSIENQLNPEGLEIGWDGHSKGKPLGVGVYSFILEIEFSDGNILMRSGEVSLIR